MYNQKITNMKFKKLFFTSLTICSGLLAAACSQEQSDFGTKQTVAADTVVTMYWDSSSPSFDDEQDTRAVTTSWDNGSMLYLRLKNGNSWTTATATYNATTENWDVTGISSLPTTSSETACQITYLQNQAGSASNTISLTSGTIPFQTTGTYTHPTASELYLSGTLKPIVWRFRFKGSNGTTVTLSRDCDIQVAHSFDKTTGVVTFAKLSQSVELNVTNGYTPYVYGRFKAETGSQHFCITTGSASWERDLAVASLPIAVSGCFTVPTNSTPNGWEQAQDIIIPNCKATPNLMLTTTVGMSTDWNVESNVAISYWDVFEATKYNFTSDNDDQAIIDVLKQNDGIQNIEDKISSSRGWNANTQYYLCCISYDSSGQRGELVKVPFKTNATTLPMAEVSNLKAATRQNTAIWSFDITSRNSCTSYYDYGTFEQDWYDEQNNQFLAWLVYYWIHEDNDFESDSSFGSFYFNRTTNYITYITFPVTSSGQINGNYSIAKATNTSTVKKDVRIENGANMPTNSSISKKKLPNIDPAGIRFVK